MDKFQCIYKYGFLCYNKENKKEEISMAATKSLSIRVDDEVKRQSDAVLSTLGLSTSSVVNMLLRTIARNHAIPAELFTTKPIDTREERNRAYLEKLDRGFEAYRRGLCIRHDLIEVEDDDVEEEHAASSLESGRVG